MSGCRRAVAVLLSIVALQAVAAEEEDDTIASLENRTVQLAESGVIPGSSDKARDNYRAFLELVSDDPVLRAEAMRRLADLELEAAQARQLDGGAADGAPEFDDAIALFQRLLEAYPDYRRSDSVLYQLARAYEIGGRADEALRVLDELVARHPDTPFIAEAQFRRGEMLFLRREYAAAEAAYVKVVALGNVCTSASCTCAESQGQSVASPLLPRDQSLTRPARRGIPAPQGSSAQSCRASRDATRFYEQSLYKLGWSRFKLARHEESLVPFFALLDRKLAGIEIGAGEDRLPGLGRAEKELVLDTFRVLSITFSYMDGPASIRRHFERHGTPEYAHVIYLNLGELYLEKERYVDAARAFHAFVEGDPWHARAPLLEIRAIEAYRRGDFASLVLDGKEAFVERYGMDSEYWVHNPPAANPEVVAAVKANLTDLARHHHARAQARGAPADYREAARWYRRYLDWFPGEPDSASTNFLLAEILFESGDYEAATSEYERTAYEYPRHPRSSEAAYAAILSYLEREKELEGPVRAEWHAKYLDSGLRFADAFPEHRESGAVLTTIAEDLFRQKEYDLAIAVGHAVAAKTPPVRDELARTAWRVIAHSEFDRGDFAAAEAAYYRLRPLTPADDREATRNLEERIASSIYKQGELARDSGDLPAAVEHFMRVGRAVPGSSIRETAEYDAAAALINLGQWERAAAVLEGFRRDHPESRFADDVTQKLAVAYLEAGKGIEAAGEFERIADGPAAAGQVGREALWKAAELYQENGRSEEERAVLERYVERYPEWVGESIEALARLLEIAEAGGDARARTGLLHAIIEADGAAGAERTDRTRYLAAKATLDLAEPAHRRFMAVRISQPLADSLALKKERMEEVLAAYGKAADYEVAEVTTAATHRLGDVYREFARDLMESERPRDLDPDALGQYELLLEEQAFPFEEKAIELYEANAARAALGIYDEWVRASFAELATLVPARYAKAERSEDVVTALY